MLARSDQASVGDAIVQPGLIDNNCTPNGDGLGNFAGGISDRLAAAQFKPDQRGRGHCAGELGRRELDRQHSRTGRSQDAGASGRSASGHLLHGRQGRESYAST